MTRPHVTIHNTTSVDGRMTGFPVRLDLHYEIAGQLPHDAALSGSTTLLVAADGEGVSLAGEDPVEPTPAIAADDPRPWLVIVDSRGRLTRLRWLRGQPFWRDVLVLCSHITPQTHLDRLRRHHVEHLVVGADRVDLSAALPALSDRYGIRRIRVDAGGTLNGCLVRAGLVDEISLIVAPYLATTEHVPLMHGVTGPDAPHLTLTDVRRLDAEHVWLRYTVNP